jgi:uncharacterized RDD family membrane protein YckC
LSTTSPTPQFEPQSNRLPSWKQEVNDRLEAHRTRRTRSSDRQPNLPGMEDGAEAESKAARVAARVAARYAKAPSYEEMLAAARAAEAAAQAAAEAEQAAREAHQAAQAMLAGFDEPEVIPQHPDSPLARQEATAQRQSAPPEPAVAEPAAPPAPLGTARIPITPRVSQAPERTRAPREEQQIVDPFEDAFVVPSLPLPAKLLEFPRELIATRKARPRREEGPLLGEATVDTDPERSQLRIFEVEGVSQEAPSQSALPEWSNIRLDAGPAQGREPMRRQHQNAGSSHADAPLHPASLEDRLMAGIVDTALVLVAFLVFVLVFVACTAHPPTGKPAWIGAGIALVVFFVLYQLMFFNWGEGTPGMRYAHIALCTFDDENPTRKAMRSRVFALLLSAMPLGLGFLWAFFDEDRLGWHDRISQTYQRSYR